MDIKKLEKLTGLRQSPLVDILYLEQDLIPMLYQFPDGKGIVSKLVISGGFDGMRNPISFKFHGSYKRKWSRGGWESEYIRKRVAIYETEEEVAEAFKVWARKGRDYLKQYAI